jgi:hypothetical protein
VQIECAFNVNVFVPYVLVWLYAMVYIRGDVHMAPGSVSFLSVFLSRLACLCTMVEDVIAAWDEPTSGRVLGQSNVLTEPSMYQVYRAACLCSLLLYVDDVVVALDGSLRLAARTGEQTPCAVQRRCAMCDASSFGRPSHAG